jgi:LemA protein
VIVTTRCLPYILFSTLFREGVEFMRSSFTKLVLVPVAAFSLASCGINSVPAAQEVAKAKWADVESAYQRRADLIPNVVEAVKGAAKSEGKILQDVTDARARATSINITTNDLSDPATFEKFSAAQNQLTQAMGQLRTVVEAYPQLQSQARFGELMTDLGRTENRIDIARRDYNEAVRQYNTTIRTFPDIIGAKIIHGAQPMIPFKAITANAQEAPKIDLTTDK